MENQTLEINNTMEQPVIETVRDGPKYVVLCETSGKHNEAWYSFIKYTGNEENIHDLKRQLDSVDWYIIQDLSVFDFDIDHFVSEKTAKEMTKIKINNVISHHRKFDGTLQKICLGLDKIKNNDKKIEKCWEMLGIGAINQFIDCQDCNSDSDSDVSSYVTDYSYSIDDDSDSDCSMGASSEQKTNSTKGNLATMSISDSDADTIPMSDSDTE